MAALNRLYLGSPELYECDFSENGFSWLLADEAERNLVVYLRRSASGSEMLVAVSFSGAASGDITVRVERGRYRPIFGTHTADAALNTDAEGHLVFSLPPFGGIVFKKIKDTVEL